MKRALPCLLSLFASLPAWGLSQRTADIFDKRNRVLDPPSEELRSDQAEIDYRLSAEAQRLKRAPAAVADDDAVIEEDDEGDGHVRANLRRQRRKKAESEYDFAGDRIFGIGFVGAGAYGIFGGEAELSVGKALYVGAGLGTGMSYSSWGFHARFLLNQGRRVNTFFQAGYANWQLGKVSATGKGLHPQHLAQEFFGSDGRLTAGEHVNIVYPGLGVHFFAKSGLSAAAQIQYLMNLNGFDGGLSGALGFYFYY